MVTIKPAVQDDCGEILEMIKELADFEKLSDQVTATVDDLVRLLFKDKAGRALIVRWDGKPAGYCIYFYNLSTFKCKKGIYIEDIFVRPEYRKNGIGVWMLQMVARTAAEENCGRLEWACLDWNTYAKELYSSLGASEQSGWVSFRVDENELPAFGTPKCRCCKENSEKG